MITRPTPKPVPQKRDFQDHNPPKTLKDLYAKYDPSIGAGIALTLGVLLAYLLISVATRWLWKRLKLRLQRYKRFRKYFPEDELPPLHIAQRIATEQGFIIPEALMKQLMMSGEILPSAPMLSRKSSEAFQSALKLPNKQNKKAVPILVKKTSFHRTTVLFPPNAEPITVNIIGATPSLTPNCSDVKLYAFEKNSDEEHSNNNVDNKATSTKTTKATIENEERKLDEFIEQQST